MSDRIQISSSKNPKRFAEELAQTAGIPNEKELLEAFSRIERHDLKPNAIGCAVCGQWLNLKTKKGKLCNHLRHDFGLPELKEILCNI
jgi:hypothetical protein